MNVVSRTLRWLLFSLSVSVAVLVMGSYYRVPAQALCGNGRRVGPCDGNELSFPGSLSNDNGLQLGRGVALCLANDCTILVGVIDTVDIDQENRIAHMRFNVSERLRANADRGSDESEITISWSPKGEDTFFDVRLEPGSRLMIGLSPNGSLVYFVLGNEKYFSSVRSTMLFHGVNNLQKSFASVLEPLKDRRDNIFAGYVSDNVWRLATVENRDENLAVLEQIITDPSFPIQGLVWIGDGMSSILRFESIGLSDASRDQAIRKLFEVASSNDKDRAEIAIRVLASISEKDWFQPRRYLDRSVAQRLIQQIHKSAMSPNGPGPLEKKLSKIN